jgi:hypothetical protein
MDGARSGHNASRTHARNNEIFSARWPGILRRMSPTYRTDVATTAVAHAPACAATGWRYTRTSRGCRPSRLSAAFQSVGPCRAGEPPDTSDRRPEGRGDSLLAPTNAAAGTAPTTSPPCFSGVVTWRARRQPTVAPTNAAARKARQTSASCLSIVVTWRARKACHCTARLFKR